MYYGGESDSAVVGIGPKGLSLSLCVPGLMLGLALVSTYFPLRACFHS